MTHHGLDHRGGLATERIRPDQTLIARIGGRPVVDRIVNGLYSRIEADPSLRPMFIRDIAAEREKQKDFWEEWLGGEPRQAMVLLDRVRPQQQRTMFLKAAQRLKFSQEGKWLLATTRTGSFESGTARLMVALGADVALAASGNKKGQVRISSRASSTAIEAGLNLTQLLEALADEQDGSAGGHPGAAGFQAQGDPDALLAMAQQGCVAQLKSLAEGA